MKIVVGFGDRIRFIHPRNVSRHSDGSFYEAEHLWGSAHLDKVMKVAVKEQKRRVEKGGVVVSITMWPDHGQVLLDDKKGKMIYIQAIHISEGHWVWHNHQVWKKESLKFNLNMIETAKKSVVCTLLFVGNGVAKVPLTMVIRSLLSGIGRNDGGTLHYYLLF